MAKNGEENLIRDGEIFENRQIWDFVRTIWPLIRGNIFFDIKNFFPDQKFAYVKKLFDFKKIFLRQLFCWRQHIFWRQNFFWRRDILKISKFWTSYGPHDQVTSWGRIGNKTES